MDDEVLDGTAGRVKARALKPLTVIAYFDMLWYVDEVHLDLALRP